MSSEDHSWQNRAVARLDVLLDCREVSELCGVGRRSVSEWCRLGWVKAVRLGTAGGRYRIRGDDVVRHLSRTSRGRRHWAKAVLAKAAEVEVPSRPKRPKTPRILDVRDVAALVGASPRTVRRWIKNGALHARTKGVKGSMFRVKRESLAAFLRGAAQSSAPAPPPSYR